MNVDSLLESSSESLIQLPRGICGSHHEDTFLRVTTTVHLNQELGLNSPRWFIFTFSSFSAQGVYLINENEWWLPLPCHLEQMFDEFFRFSLPFRHQIGRRNGEESWVAFCGTGLGEETLTSSGRAIQQDTCPRLSFTLEELREFYRHDDSFFKAFFCSLQPCYIWPLYVWLFRNDSWRQRVLKFLILIITSKWKTKI